MNVLENNEWGMIEIWVSYEWETHIRVKEEWSNKSFVCVIEFPLIWIKNRGLESACVLMDSISWYRSMKT